MCKRIPESLLAAIVIFSTPLALTAGEPNEKDQAAIAELRKQLEKPVSVEMLDMPMARALELLAKRASVKVMLMGRADRDGFRRTVNMTLDGARAIDILDVLCEEAGLFYEIRPGELRLASILDHNARRVVFRTYDVNDLTSSVKDYPSTQAAFHLPPDLQVITEHANAFVAAADTTCVTPANIADIIRTHIRPDSWDPALGTSIEERSGRLIVMQTEEVHMLIRRLLAGFRSRASRQVGIEVKVVAVNSGDLDPLLAAMKARGVVPPSFDDQGLAAVEEWVTAGRAQTLYAGSTIAYNTQMGRLGDMKTRRMIADYDVSGDSFEPVASELHDGTRVSFRPTLSDDGKTILASVRAVHARTLPDPEAFAVVRGGGIPTTQTVSTTQPTEGEKTTETNYQGATTLPAMQLHIPTVIRSRVSQDMVFEANRYAALMAPLGGEDGAIPGHEMLVLMRCRPLIAPAPLVEPEKADLAEIPAELKQRLNRKINLTLIETPFQKAVEVFAAQAGVPVVLDRTALGARLTAPVMLELKDSSASEALELLLRAGAAAVIPRTSLLQVTSRQKVNARRVSLRVFDIRDVTTVLTDYPGEQIGNEDTSQSAGIQFVTPTTLPTLAAPDLAQIIRERLMPEQFADEVTSMEEQGGNLVVVNTPEALARIEEILNAIRRNAQRPILTTARWVIVNAADLREILGKDPPDTLSPADMAKLPALLAKPGSRSVGVSRLACFNAQRVSSFGGMERPQVVDYDVSGHQHDPVLRSRRSGLILDIVPLLMEGTGEQGFPSQFRLELRTTLAKSDTSSSFDPIPQGPDAQVESRPGLAVRSGRIHTPTSDVRQVETTVRIINGGAALFRFTAPEWIEGENAEAIKKGERVGIVIVQAEQPK